MSRQYRFFATSGTENFPPSATVVYVLSSDASWVFADVAAARSFARDIGAPGICRVKGSRAKELDPDSVWWLWRGGKSTAWLKQVGPVHG